MRYSNAQELVQAAIVRRATKQELARELGIAPETLNAYSLGKRKPSYDVTMKLLRITENRDD